MKESLIRTVVPFVVGWLISLPVVAWLGLTQEQVTAAVTVVIGAIYYLLVRIIERRFPSWGWLLGMATAPTYGQVNPPTDESGL
mgnify:CR=1 FL=1